jgi:hypothetical protein
MFDYQRVSIKNGTRQKNWRNECQQERRGFQQQNLGFPAAQKEMKLLESWINEATEMEIQASNTAVSLPKKIGKHCIGLF